MLKFTNIPKRNMLQNISTAFSKHFSKFYGTTYLNHSFRSSLIYTTTQNSSKDITIPAPSSTPTYYSIVLHNKFDLQQGFPVLYLPECLLLPTPTTRSQSNPDYCTKPIQLLNTELTAGPSNHAISCVLLSSCVLSKPCT